jgi:hypothetical protein
MNSYFELLLKILGIIPILIIPFAFLNTRITDRRNVLLNDIKILHELDKESEEYKMLDEYIKRKVERMYGTSKLYHKFQLFMGILFLVLSISVSIYFFITYGFTFVLYLVVSNVITAIAIISSAYKPKGIATVFED